MRVEITAEAEDDLRQISLHIAAQDAVISLEFLGKLRDACEGLASFPKRYPLVPRYEGAGIRHRTIGNYLIFYCVNADRVTVIHVLHGARDYSSILDLKL